MQFSENTFANTSKCSRQLKPNSQKAWFGKRAAAREDSAGQRFGARSSMSHTMSDTRVGSDAQQKKQTHKNAEKARKTSQQTQESAQQRTVLNAAVQTAKCCGDQ